MSIIELDQKNEILLSHHIRGPISVRYAYTRSRDRQEKKFRGQDYLVFRVEPQRMVFALCDGVGKSFMGGLAAQIVGEFLIEELWNISDDSNNIEEVKPQLVEQLNKQKQIATRIIYQKNLSFIHEDLARIHLEKRRDNFGTQTNFVCGLIDSPSKNLPLGRVFLFWLGDAKLKIFLQKENKTQNLQADWSSSEAWSSKEGVVGVIHSYYCNLNDIDCIIAHSDGLDSFQDQLSGISDDKLVEEIKNLKQSPGSDDISYLEINFSNEMIYISDDLTSLMRLTFAKKNQEIEEKIVQHEVPKDPIKPADVVYQNKPWVKWALGGLVILLVLSWIITFIIAFEYVNLLGQRFSNTLQPSALPTLTITFPTPTKLSQNEIQTSTTTPQPYQTSTTTPQPTPKHKYHKNN
jgi:hypothetical protein